MGAQQAPPGLGPVLEDQARPSQNLVRTWVHRARARREVGGREGRGLRPYPALPSTSSSSAHLSPSLRALWGPLQLQGSPRLKVPLRPPRVGHQALQEQPLGRLLQDPS